jgi:hypothetical protein
MHVNAVGGKHQLPQLGLLELILLNLLQIFPILAEVAAMTYVSS